MAPVSYLLQAWILLSLHGMYDGLRPGHSFLKLRNQEKECSHLCYSLHTGSHDLSGMVSTAKLKGLIWVDLTDNAATNSKISLLGTCCALHGALFCRFHPLFLVLQDLLI